jgi:glyoxylase-like metal-dependent hydrolase (beta-lactamase superfamily II)
VVLSSLSLVLLPEISARHPMMSAVFLPAPFWAIWHVVSISRLWRGARLRAATASLLLLALAVSMAGCRPLILRTVMTTVDPYFHGEEVDRIELTRLTPRVWTFQWNWYRNLVISTAEGLVVIDPMGPAAAGALKEALSREFPGVPVKRVVYSHYHLDHVRGASELAPSEVIAHANCQRYWAALDSGETSDVLPPTRTITGDTDISLGGVEIHALDMGLSHTDTLLAFYLPRERVLFTADLGLVKTVAPTGVPDRYAPGYLAALDRLATLDFDVFVPSHFGFGRKQDLVEWRDMLEYGRTLARRAIAHSGSFGVQQSQLGRYFDDIYYPMRERYGAWHGFDEMIVLNIVRDIEGEGLGH